MSQDLPNHFMLSPEEQQLATDPKKYLSSEGHWKTNPVQLAEDLSQLASPLRKSPSKECEPPQPQQEQQEAPSQPSILAEAKAIIYGDREQTYGHPSKNLLKIASLWSTYLETEIDIDDVCSMMILLKIARLQNQPEHRDSQVDICGYAALMNRCQQSSKGN